MGNIPEEVLLARIKRETAAREAAIAALLSQLENATAESQQKITAVASKLTAQIGGQTVNSSAIAGVILTSQVEPGFAYASELTLLEAKVTDNKTYSDAQIVELREVTATQFEATAQETLTIKATFNASKAQFEQQITANANATTALTTRTTSLESTVNNPTTGVAASAARITTEETTRATQTSALATRSTALESTVNNGTTGVAATAARLTTEENTRATQTSALASRATTLESTVNNPTTGVAATLARLVTEETTRASADSAISSTVTTLTATVNTNNTTLTAAINNEASTRATQDTAISNTVSSLTSTVNGNSANITTLQTTTATQSSAISTLQTTVSSHGTSITTAQNTANSAQSAANTAQATANAKATTFSQGTAPTANAVGDLWIDTANNNQIKRWNGSSWVDASDVRIVSLQSSITTLQSANTTQDSTIASLSTTVSAQSTSITNAQNSANAAQSAANAAQTTANVATASVTSEATARANADGTLSARASLSLDVNGNVAGYKIGSDVNLAGVTTSVFSITADTFKIFNGTDKISPFYVTGGVVHMTNVVADTIAANISITTPTIYGGWLKFDGGSESKITSTVYESLVRVNGGASDGQGSGGQIDLLGNNYTTVPGYNGSVLLTPGNASNAGVYIRDRWSNDKIWVGTDGTSYIRQGNFNGYGNGTFDGSFSGSHSGSYSGTLYGVGFSGTGFNVHPGSDNYMVTGEDGGAYGANTAAYLAMRVNGRTVWVPFFDYLP